MAMTTELNMVEGFNPTDYARTITDADGQQSQYLDVQYRKMWFRLRNPNGKTLGQIAVEDFSSIKWLAESYRRDKNLYKGAARIILNRHTGGN